MATQLQHDHIRDMATLAALGCQPQVPAEFHLLHAGYQHGDLLLDLYGERDGSEYNVLAVTLAGTTANIEELVSKDQIIQMNYWLETHCPVDRAQERREDAAALMSDLAFGVWLTGRMA